jgi:hypothetical protein
LCDGVFGSRFVCLIFEKCIASAALDEDTEIGIRELMTVCLNENDRRFAGYDPRLLRPDTMPRLVRLALRFIRR